MRTETTAAPGNDPATAMIPAASSGRRTTGTAAGDRSRLRPGGDRGPDGIGTGFPGSSRRDGKEAGRARDWKTPEPDRRPG